jgi:hypothetical protein
VIDEGLAKYLFLMDRLHIVDVSRDDCFQRVYNNFYRVRQRPKEFYKAYYTFLQKNKDNKSLAFGETLRHFYKKTERIEASFSSKLLATVNPEMPIWDSYVLGNIGLKRPPYVRKGQLEKSVGLYNELIDWYRDYLKSPNGKDMLALFDKTYPKTGISKTKKVDFVLWQMRDRNDDYRRV